ASVGVDERAAGEIATRHLIELGHTRVGFVAGPAYARPTRDKAAGRADALAAAGIRVDQLVAYAPWGVEGGRQAMRKLLRLDRRRQPTAVICSSDLMAIGALREAQTAGIHVPDELSIVGFDGIGATEWTQPPLTTLLQPVTQIAASAVEALESLVSQPTRSPTHAVFRPELVLRASTAPPERPCAGKIQRPGRRL